jgi:hypothetical protein
MAEEINSKALQRLVDDLLAAHGSNLAAVVLYGSTAVTEQPADGSSHDVLIVLRRIALADLESARAAVRAWTRAGHPMPVYFSMSEMQGAADVFAIEFLQMENARVVLYGEDPFAGLTISGANLRHQTEYELRTKFLQLRRLYFASAGSAAQLMRLMTDSLSSFVALFRAVLTLNGEPSSGTKAEAIAAIARRLPVDPKPFERIRSFAEGKQSQLTEPETQQLFADYLAQIEHVIDSVDQLHE